MRDGNVKTNDSEITYQIQNKHSNICKVPYQPLYSVHEEAKIGLRGL